MCSVGTTLTLPGIAGIVLTVGMAVDANVLIFERIREESAKGKSLRGAIAAGYDRAFGTIFDSHVTTLISSIILIFMGTGSIKGFGVALTIGVAASLFTALVVTRLIFDFLLDADCSNRMPHAAPHSRNQARFHEAGQAGLHCVLADYPRRSWLRCFIAARTCLGIDFVGGDNVTLRLPRKVDAGQLRAALTEAKVTRSARFNIKRTLPTGKPKSLRVTVAEFGTAVNVPKVLDKGVSSCQLQTRRRGTRGPDRRRGNSEVRHHRLVAVAVRHPGLRRFPL